MCGIYGTTLPYTKQQIRQKLERTQFRGPDQLGMENFKTKSDDTIYFGHNRLSIIDLDPRSNQPFSYNDTVHLVFNGEIYNFKTLRDELHRKGHEFKTTSDTEVICAAYLEFGEKCVDYFNGMFAFVIYDVKKQLLFGAKDRLGQKPFYYQISDNGFEFASQISSIQLFNEKLTINKKAINQYLSWNAVPDPISIFNEIKKIEDGCCFTYTLDTQKFKTWTYWNIKQDYTNNFTGSYNDATNELETLLTNAVNLRMAADVPLGVFLSGGIDSSLIAALATKSSVEKIKTFSVKFNEKGFDESIYAQKVARHLQTDHNIIECDYREGIDLISNFNYYFDEPFADASAIPSMLLSKHTKKQVTVALSGDAADESFLGYPRYKILEKINKTQKIPLELRKFLTSIFDRSNIKRYHAIKNILKANNHEEAYLELSCTRKASWLNNTYDPIEEDKLKYLFHQNKNIFDRVGDFDLKTYLSWDINTKVDRATMAYSLEARSPFLDYRVVEFAQRLPTEFKYQSTNQKRILKEILYKHVPKSYFDRPKSGFAMPLEIWFRKELRELVLEELSLNNLEELPGINPIMVHNYINEHMDGKWNHYQMIWKLLVLKKWIDSNNQYSIL